MFPNNNHVNLCSSFSLHLVHSPKNRDLRTRQAPRTPPFLSRTSGGTGASTGSSRMPAPWDLAVSFGPCPGLGRKTAHLFQMSFASWALGKMENICPVDSHLKPTRKIHTYSGAMARTIRGHWISPPGSSNLLLGAAETATFEGPKRGHWPTSRKHQKVEGRFGGDNGVSWGAHLSMGGSFFVAQKPL